MKALLRSLLLLVMIAGCSRSGSMLQSPRVGGKASPNSVTSTNTISGVVLNGSSGNSAVAGILVTAVAYDTSTSLPFTYDAKITTYSAVTDASGHYNITGAPDGMYFVYARPHLVSTDDVEFAFGGPLTDTPHPNTSLVPQWHDGSTMTTAHALTAAHHPVVLAGGLGATQNFTLHSDARHWSGDCKFEMSGTPAVGEHVMVTTGLGNGTIVRGVLVALTTTDVSGNFSFSGLPNSADVTAQFPDDGDPAIPGYFLVAQSAHQLRGDDPRGDIHVEFVPKTLGPGSFFVLDHGTVNVGGLNNDGEDASQNSSDILQLAASEFTNNVFYDSLQCSGINILRFPQAYRVDISLDDSPTANLRYRLHVLMTDNLSLSGYSDVVIQTFSQGGGHVEDGHGKDLPGMPVADASNPSNSLYGNSGGVGADAPLISPVFHQVSDDGHPGNGPGFVTQGPAFATDIDRDGDPIDPGTSKISWFFNIADLGTLSGGGTGFYIYVETIGASNKTLDVAPNVAGQPKQAAPMFINVFPFSTGGVICGKTGVI